MDFEPRFDCCKACNSISFQCQNNNRSPIQIQGQGDCKCTTEGNKSVWMSRDKGKKVRSMFVRERQESEPTDRQNYLDGHCYCFAKQDLPDKVKEDLGIFDDCGYFWDTPAVDWTTKNEPFFVTEPQARSSEKLLAENILDFEEKVDFLFRLFKDYGQKFPPEGFIDQSQGKQSEGMFKDVGRLFDFNKRLCAAEEGIEKLALILEDLVKDSSSRKTENSDSVDFDDMSVSQRINYLKSRNDLMLSFMRAFLKAGSAEEPYSLFSRGSSELKPLKTKVDKIVETQSSRDLDRMRIMETLQTLRMRMTELREKKFQSYNEQHKGRNEKKGEKYPRNKLEVISEQAELALSDESDVFGTRSTVQILKEKLSEANEESDESDLSVQDVTFRILSQESEFLTQPLDKIFSNSKSLDSSEKKFINGSNIKISLKEESNQDDVVVNYDSSSETSCFFCDGEDSEKAKDRNKMPTLGKQKEMGRREKNSLEKATKDKCKQGGGSGKRGEEYLEGSVQPCRKILHDGGYTVFSGKGNQITCSLPGLCSPSREERKQDVRRKEQRQRPVTEPSSHRKTLPPSGLKPPTAEKHSTRNSGTHNVKSKNKILFSKKSCVQTS